MQTALIISDTLGAAIGIALGIVLWEYYRNAARLDEMAGQDKAKRLQLRTPDTTFQAGDTYCLRIKLFKRTT